ncbi:glycerophosphodiester phosphodiesterase family protein [Hymenobacter convexus]|uniref:glycerophosphodiester phosphodiesterase family protein n=1 Tax=Hymenobacter sp. CA1UV-4 TaxID=3063782 RepID=UPI002713BC44|nr:glycerophosphodiester phosphodiesterase family protein [Hymenobacter sp. CA1UV-4]MDO7850171.1 glycerophosphodiester phosphodiesterase family protein [Hymenobacter sp. CA1UV-4]
MRRLSFTAAIYSPQLRRVTEELVQACHQRRLQVIPWTVNAPADAARLQALQVDGLITDYPDMVKTE